MGKILFSVKRSIKMCNNLDYKLYRSKLTKDHSIHFYEQNKTQVHLNKCGKTKTDSISKTSLKHFRIFMHMIKVYTTLGLSDYN